MKTVYIFLIFVAFFSCKQKETKKDTIENKKIKIEVSNPLEIDRNVETITLNKEALNLKASDSLENYTVFTSNNLPVAVTQLVDLDGDALMDELLFQVTLQANEKKEFTVKKEKVEIEPIFKIATFAKFVPERLDDFAWENDRVAFRMYGPALQKAFEKGEEGGGISSGIDCWLKKVDYPVVKKWYAEHEIEAGAYHKDTGEGLDNYHVGSSRGCGGLSVKIKDKFYSSKNYTEYKIIALGPIRTIFDLFYEDWDAAGNKIKETKRISLDLGSNLTKYDISISGTDVVNAGVTLHEKDGKVTENAANKWVSYWQPHDISELGTAVICDSKYFKDIEVLETDTSDESHAYLNLNVIDNKVIYYAGFGWKENNRFQNQIDWENYLNYFSKTIEAPLKLSVLQ